MKSDETPVVGRAGENQPISNPDPLARTRRDALARILCVRICSDRRTETELRVIDLLLGGIELHEPEYGPADAGTDLRDLTDELDQELTDGLFYILLRAVKRRASRLERLECEVADEIARQNPVDHGLRELAAFDVSDTDGNGGHGR